MEINKVDSQLIMESFDKGYFLWELTTKQKSLIKRILVSWPELEKSYPVLAEAVIGKA